MPIVQLLFGGGGTYTQNQYSTTTATKPRVTVIPTSALITLGLDLARVRNVTAEVWGAGGASGSAVYGTSGNGGGGGYVSAEIPVDLLNISTLIIRVGGGGGNPLYSDSPIGEYTEFIVNPNPITYVGGTSATNVTSIDLTTINFETVGDTLQPGDLVLVTSVASGGTLNNPTGYTSVIESAPNLSYQIYRKFMGATVDTQIANLSDNTGGNGGDASHAVLVFRNVDTNSPILTSASASNNNDSSPNPPSITTTIENSMGVIFGFLDGTSLTNNDISAPNGWIERIVQGSAGGNNQSTVMTATNLLEVSGANNPDVFTVNNQGPTAAFTLALRPQVMARFSSAIGGRGGSSGGYSGIFYSLGGTITPLIIAGGGGGGGGTSIDPVAANAIAGSGGAGGGTVASDGFSGSLVSSGLLSYFPAGAGGQGGGDGVARLGGLGGTTLISPGTLGSTTNPGEAGVIWNAADIGGFLTGGRGANSPGTDVTSIPLYGANSTGGWNRGSGGGSSRTSTFGVEAGIPSSCGGAGGGGYYGGGGGGSGSVSPAGGGGGGSNYIDSNLFVIANVAGSGVLPGNTTSPNLALQNAPVNPGYGGFGVLGTGSNVQGNDGNNGFVVLSYFIT